MLALFLFSWRSALISLITIPISLTASALVLHWRGTTINTMVLGRLRHRARARSSTTRSSTPRTSCDDCDSTDGEGGDRGSTARVIYDASLEVRGAVVYASVIEALALLPVFFLKGLTGAFFQPLAMSYALAVVVSMVVALVTTPALSLDPAAQREARAAASRRLASGLQRGYERLLRPIVRRPVDAYVAVALDARRWASASYPRLGQELLPEFKERDFLMHWVTQARHLDSRSRCGSPRQLPPSSGRSRACATSGRTSARRCSPTSPTGCTSARTGSASTSRSTTTRPFAKIQEVVDGYPGLRRDVQTYLKERIREVLTGSSDTINVKIFGDDLETLRDTADDVKEMMGEVDGVVDENVSLHQGRAPGRGDRSSSTPPSGTG